jgi:hypothetical protein
MSETISLDLIGKLLRDVQAQQRTQRGDTELLRKDVEMLRRDLTKFATREELMEVLRVIVDRIANFEALMESRFDRLSAQVGKPVG